MFATFALAIDKAAEACPEAEKLMGICAFLAPDRIPLDLFTKDVLSEIERGEAVAAFEVSLVTLETLDDGSPGVSVHGLVQQVMRGRLPEMEGKCNRARDWACSGCFSPRPGMMPLAGMHGPAALPVFEHTGRWRGCPENIAVAEPNGAQLRISGCASRRSTCQAQQPAV